MFSIIASSSFRPSSSAIFRWEFHHSHSKVADATSIRKLLPTFTTLASTICRLSFGKRFSFRSTSDSMSLRILAKAAGEVAGLNCRYPCRYCTSCRCRISGDPQAIFQAVQAAFRRFCLSPIVSPTPKKPAAISEIISDILRLVEGLDFFDRVMVVFSWMVTDALIESSVRFYPLPDSPDRMRTKE